MQVDPIKPTLKAPGTECLKLECDEPPSNFAFKINLRRYTVDQPPSNMDVDRTAAGGLLRTSTRTQIGA